MPQQYKINNTESKNNVHSAVQSQYNNAYNSQERQIKEEQMIEIIEMIESECSKIKKQRYRSSTI